MEQVRQRTLALLAQAGAHFSVTMEPVDIRFDLRGRAAGMVRVLPSGTTIIRYNRAMLEKYRDGFIRQTVPHEVAHVVVAALHPNKTAPHGPEWRTVMSYFGADPRRCHAFQVDGKEIRQLTRFNYRCGCREHRLTAIRHNRINRGQGYSCRHCGEILRPA